MLTSSRRFFFLLSLPMLFASALHPVQRLEAQENDAIVSKDVSGVSLDPAEFHANSGPQKQWTSDLIDEIKFKGNENVLDVGSADGKLTAIIASKVPKGNVLGVDISQAMVDFANNVYGVGHKNLTFQQGDARQLNLNQQFDIVISTSTFHWFSDQESAISSLAKVLKPGGTLFMRVYPIIENKDSLLDRVITKVASRLKWRMLFYSPRTVFSGTKKKDLQQQLNEHGFTVKRLKKIKCEYAFKDRQEFLNWILVWRKVLQTAPSPVSLPDAIYKGFAEEVVDEYLKKQPASSKGQIPYVEYMLDIEAQKAVT